MALEILWSKKADRRFDSIIAYLQANWGERTVSIFVKKVFDFLNLLSVFPEIGTIENKALGIRGFVVVKQITIFYQIRESNIVLLNFHDNRQNPKKSKY